jgi:hypothetical protein
MIVLTNETQTKSNQTHPFDTLTYMDKDPLHLK